MRYAVRRALDREVDRLVIHIDGLRVQPGGAAARGRATGRRPRAIRSRDLADSGTDVA